MADGATSAFASCKARDLFAAADDVFPLSFYGYRVHLLLKSREPWTLFPDGGPAPPPSSPRWSAASMIKLSTRVPCGRPGATLRAAATLGVRWPSGRSASGTAEVNAATGDWSYEAVGRSAGGAVHVSAVGQVCAWRRPLTCACDVDYDARPAGRGALSARVDPVRGTCVVQCLQSVSCRLSLGAEMGFSSAAKPGAVAFRPALLARYAGPAYLLCGRAEPLTGRAKVAWYRHNGDRLQTSVTVEADGARSAAVARMAFRVTSRRSAVRAAVDTDGVVSSLLELRLAGGVAVSLSARVQHNAAGRPGSGLGVGLSFG